MRRFLKTVFFLAIIPLLGLTALYFLTDPYKTLKTFSLEYFDSTNRDYVSSELFLLNYPKQKYDSFILGSSRGCGLNTYHWAKYLPEGSNQFLFQAWGETLTGIEQKIEYIDDMGGGLKNVIILFDIPGSFTGKQLPTNANTIKDPNISGQPKWKYQLTLLADFIQKPSQWIRTLHNPTPAITFDTITNDWDSNNRFADLSTPPAKDSLSSLSSKAKAAFLIDISNKTDDDLVCSDPVISHEAELQLRHIRELFDQNRTDYKIIITPAYCFSFPSISPLDLSIMELVFGKNNVYDFSGKNRFTEDYNNFSDPNHFGQHVGWVIIESIYNQKDDL